MRIFRLPMNSSSNIGWWRWGCLGRHFLRDKKHAELFIWSSSGVHRHASCQHPTISIALFISFSSDMFTICKCLSTISLHVENMQVHFQLATTATPTKRLLTTCGFWLQILMVLQNSFDIFSSSLVSTVKNIIVVINGINLYNSY